MSEQPIVIKKVTAVKQRGFTIYVAHIPAIQLAHLCRIDRFDEGEGVQRQINDNHVLDIAEAMSNPKILWLDPWMGALIGDWKYERGKLIGTGNAVISLDDGQHRWKALSTGILQNQEVAHLQFEIKMIQGLNREDRMRIFRAQSHRRGIDRRLDLAQRHALDEWKNDTHRHAYRVVLTLNSDPSSPLQGRVQLIDKATRPYERGGEEGATIPSSGLHNSLVTVFGKKSPLHAFDQRTQERVIMDMIRIASKVWSHAWNSDKHILTTARGINAILRLCISGSNFRGIVGLEFSPENIQKAFECAARFHWTSNRWKNRGSKDLSDSLDQSIGDGLIKAMSARADNN